MIDLSTFAKTLKCKPVALFGLGISGFATLDALTAASIKTYIWDDSADKRKEAEAKGAIVKELTADLLAQCGCLILSPGVPLTHPAPHDVVKSAHAAKTEIIGDIEILHRCNHGHKTIGITGTNGKSTTTALLTHVLNACDHPAQMGGNIGVPALALNSDKGHNNDIFVLEISSYQIDLCPTFRPDIAVLLNITPDHLDRHGTFENYAAIKHRLLNGGGKAINAETLPLPTHDFENLPGDHNKQNIATVLEICKTLCIDENKAITAIKTFPGLAHRQFLTRTIGPVKYINDSKATNAEATAKALSAYQNIHWIVGGQAKDGGLSGLEIYKDRIAHAYLIGESAEEFEQWMKEQGINYTLSQTLKSAINSAHQNTRHPTPDTRHPTTILLSPAAASWDQFKSFEHRGETFTKLVEALD